MAALWAAAASGYARHRSNLARDGQGASRLSACIGLGMLDPAGRARPLAREGPAAARGSSSRSSSGSGVVARLVPPPPRRLPRPPRSVHWARNQLRDLPLAAAMVVAAPGGDKSVAAGSRVPLPLEALEQGQTGDALWDDCQRCLAQAGELHNNARMAWGKTAVTWHAAPLLLLHHAARNDDARRSPPAGECAEAAEEQPGAPPSFVPVTGCRRRSSFSFASTTSSPSTAGATIPGRAAYLYLSNA